MYLCIYFERGGGTAKCQEYSFRARTMTSQVRLKVRDLHALHTQGWNLPSGKPQNGLVGLRLTLHG